MRMWRGHWTLLHWKGWMVLDGWIIGRVTYEWDASISSRPHVGLYWHGQLPRWAVLLLLRSSLYTTLRQPSSSTRCCSRYWGDLEANHTLVTTIHPQNVARVRARAHPGMPTRHRRGTSLLRDAHATPTPPLCPVPCRLHRSREPQPVVPRAVRRRER